MDVQVGRLRSKLEDRPEKADDDQDGARPRLHLHPGGRMVLAAGPPGLLSSTAPIPGPRLAAAAGLLGSAGPEIHFVVSVTKR
jgi:hypothetical protein